MAVHCVQQGIAFIYEVHSGFLEIRNLEWEYDVQFVDVFLELEVASLARCPGLGGYVIVYLEAPLVGESGYLEVEAWIIYEYDYVRFPGNDVRLAETQVAQELPGLAQDVRETHYCALAVMAYRIFPAGRTHQVSSPETEFRLGV